MPWFPASEVDTIMFNSDDAPELEIEVASLTLKVKVEGCVKPEVELNFIGCYS